jgi:hypothetical protein
MVDSVVRTNRDDESVHVDYLGSGIKMAQVDLAMVSLPRHLGSNRGSQQGVIPLAWQTQSNFFRPLTSSPAFQTNTEPFTK